MKMSGREREFGRKMAADCFNRAWALLEKKGRSDEDDLQMLHLAHASRYHWGLVGSPMNRAIADWQVSRVYAALGQPGLSLDFARACAAICEENELSEILHTADEAMARAYAVANDSLSARRSLNRARRRLGKLRLSREERAVYVGQIRETEALITRERHPVVDLKNGWPPGRNRIPH